MSAKEFIEFVGKKNTQNILHFLLISDPTGVFNAEESLDVIRMINGQKPAGEPICATNWARGGKLK